MARKKMEKANEATSTPKKTQPTAAEMREWYEKNKKNIENYAAARESASMPLRDIKKTTTKAVPVFSKETLRSYLQNIGSNEKNLRNLSRYLFYRCHAYYRLIMYNATMFDLNARSVIPTYDIVKGGDKKKTLKSFQDTLLILDNMNLQYEFLKMYAIAFREDVSYGCAYYDDTGFFILPLDPDYCKISGMYSTGDFAFAMDMSYFRSRQDIMEMWGSPFVEMYREFESSGVKWIDMPPEYAVALKTRAEDWETVLPVFSGMLSSIINLIDLDDIQAIADAQDIYKMLWLEMETISGSKDPDDWKVDPSIMIEYFNKMISEALPDYITAAIVPGKLNSITFDHDKTTDTNKISKSTETLFNSAGGAQILNSSTISGTTAFEAAIMADTELAISMLLPQTQAFVNRFLSYQLSNPAKVKFFEISVYTKDKFRKVLLESAQYGLPNKLALNTLSGFSERDTLALNFLEEECLGLSELLKPLVSTHTQSGDPSATGDSETGGRPKNDEPTDESEASAEKRDKARG